MKYIDVTMRDGGHQHGFYWPLKFVKKYLLQLSKFPEIDFVELGYWKQFDKHAGPFYRLNEKILSEIDAYSPKSLSIMVDYHYCSHDIKQFPTVHDFKNLGLIRVCLRKEDMKEGCKFIKKLKDYTGTMVSVNFFNITNYSDDDLAQACEYAKETNAELMYFADTHGSLDLEDQIILFQKYTSKIKQNGLIPGLHLHDHSGKAYFNYRKLSEAGFSATDISLGGLGKGLGNLKLENVFDMRGRESILDFLVEETELFSMLKGPYGILTSRDSITDHYAVIAENEKILPSRFAKLLENIDGKNKDNFNKTLMEE